VECGLSIRQQDFPNNGTVTFHYCGKPLQNLRYTVAQVREWAESIGIDRAELYPRVSKAASAAYRQAHDL
jgi:hypothetical protein